MTIRHAYVHVPFCARRCTYCDFSIAVRTVTPVDKYLRALRAELALQRTSEWSLDTLYFGGGTPSRLGEGVAEAIRIVREVAHVEDDAEVTIEANPDDVTPMVAARWAAAGVNRVSLGVQSFAASVLEWMHRTHTAKQSGQAITVLREAGITNISLDLIFALPSVLERDWRADLDQALALEPEHISLYGLTVEPHTPLGRWRDRGLLIEAPEETYERDFLLAHETLTRAGYEHYEVSNYGCPNHRSRHNSAYWSGVAYAGLGPSAHAFDGTARTWNVAPFAEWIACLSAGLTPVTGREELTDENRATERVYLGLRTSAGLRGNVTELAVAQSWVREGWAEIRDGTIVLTPTGWLRLDALAATLTLAQ